LASQSPQRRKLLRQAGYKFKVVNSKYREGVLRGLTPLATAKRHAEGKCRLAVLPRNATSGVVLGADTIVVFAGKVHGKPRDDAHAFRMLRAFSAKPQKIYTAVCLRDLLTNKRVTFVERSEVAFKKMSDRQIRDYLRTGEHRDKAGSFGLQAGAQAKSIVIAFMTQDALQKFQNSNGWKAGVDGSVALIDIGVGKTIDTDNLKDPVVGFIFGSKGLMYNLTLEGSKFTKLDKSEEE